MSKYQKEPQKEYLETIHIKETIMTAIGRVSHEYKKKDIGIEVIGNDQELRGNATSLDELFTILLDNAIKYSPSKSTIVVKIKTKAKTVSVDIKDSGVGIDKHEIPYIFNRFYRADSSRSKTTIDGYGLGLSIAKSIVDLHKGSISVESISGKGSTFTVSLPIKTEK